MALPTKPPRPRLKLSGTLSELFKTILFVVVVTVLFDMAIPRSLVEGSSMQPTFYNDERLVISRINYLINKPERGDVVVFNTLDPRKPQDMLIKRIIGLPGETVEIRDGAVYINGDLLDEPYIAEPCRPTLCSDRRWELGDDEYFVMGDNRNHSNDSRAFGAVSYDHIVGMVIFRYWPLNRIGVIHH